MKLKLDTPSRRIAFAIGISLLLHGFVLWGPNVQLPRFKSSLPALVAKLEPLPNIPARPKAKPKHKNKKRSKPAAQPQVAPNKEPPLATASQVVPASAVAAASEVTPASSVAAASAVAAVSEVLPASAPAATETLTQPTSNKAVDRPLLPRRAQLIFSVNRGTSNFKVGEMMHTLEINDGHYVLRSETETVGLARLFKTYKITQTSTGSYSKQGLQPETFTEERTEKLGSQHISANFDHVTQRAHFSHGGEINLPPDTQDILSILYQFPPLAHTETVAAFVSNGKKIERYEFEIAADESIHTKLGDLHTVHLRKLHGADEEGLEIWLSLEYRLFPVKMRIIEKNGEVSGEIVVTDIRAKFEEETKKDVAH